MKQNHLSGYTDSEVVIESSSKSHISDENTRVHSILEFLLHKNDKTERSRIIYWLVDRKQTEEYIRNCFQRGAKIYIIGTINNCFAGLGAKDSLFLLLVQLNLQVKIVAKDEINRRIADIEDLIEHVPEETIDLGVEMVINARVRISDIIALI
ncbi:hypothetical protein RF11_00436 [Thelohanellus kitauei]|uniref:Uncharacterized protein n=1 Tax=Thelohanellus kitauei TaxID=669202 RepID=A0A0C2IU81_THEKT|nr:hypothetical protein RF11_00436 [Thelohanellus kitauei]